QLERRRVLRLAGRPQLGALGGEFVRRDRVRPGRDIAAKSPVALRLGKAALDESEPLPVQEGYAVEQQYTLRLARTDDAHEALAARREKRPPVFTGK
ncbi:hypothetical protein ACWCRC_42265, partial [Streptomyces sp. NPDC001940]